MKRRKRVFARLTRFRHCKRRLSSVFDLPREYVSRKGAKASTERKRVFQRLNHVHQTRTLLANAATRLSREYVPGKSDNAINAITITCLTKSKTRFPSENIPRKGEKLVTRENVSRKAQNASSLQRLRSETQKPFYRANTSLAKAKIRLPSENMPRKGRNFFIQRTRHKQRRQSVSRTKTCPVKAETRLRSENVSRKGGNAFSREKTKQAKAKKRLPREKAFTERKRVPQAKT